MFTYRVTVKLTERHVEVSIDWRAVDYLTRRGSAAAALLGAGESDGRMKPWMRGFQGRLQILEEDTTTCLYVRYLGGLESYKYWRK